MGIIPLTGGIASGKSTVCKILETAGCKVVDTDKIAWDLVQKDQPAWKDIVDYFGKSILKSGGDIDRVELGNIIFNNSLKREKLNELTHPHIFNKTNEMIKSIHGIDPNKIIIVDIPLFFEIFESRLETDVILVYVPRNIQIERLMKREKYTREDAIIRINSQSSMDHNRKLASIVIDNSGSYESTKKITQIILEKIKNQTIATKQINNFLFDS